MKPSLLLALVVLSLSACLPSVEFSPPPPPLVDGSGTMLHSCHIEEVQHKHIPIFRACRWEDYENSEYGRCVMLGHSYYLDNGCALGGSGSVVCGDYTIIRGFHVTYEKKCL